MEAKSLQMKIIAESVRLLSQHGQWSDATAKVLRMTANFYHADRAFIVETFDTVTPSVIAENSSGQLTRHHLPDNTAAILTVVFPDRDGVLLLTHDAENADGLISHLLHTLDTTTLLAVPFFREKSIIGLLCVSQPRENAEESDLLKTECFSLFCSLQSEGRHFDTLSTLYHPAAVKTGSSIVWDDTIHMRHNRELQMYEIMSRNAYLSALIDLTEDTTIRVSGYDQKECNRLENSSFDEILSSASDKVCADESTRRKFLSLSIEKLKSRFENNQTVFEANYLRRCLDGHDRWVHEEIHLLTDPDTEHLLLFLLMHDVDDEKRRTAMLEIAAETDSMTGLLNHDAALSHITDALDTNATIGFNALFMIDLDNFKQVNDTFGHQYGDGIIIDAATAIRRVFRASDIIGRVGGDEFMVLMRDVPTMAPIRRKAGELVRALQFFCRSREKEVRVSGSVGVTICSGERRSFRKLFSEADAALYQAKSTGKNCFVIKGDETTYSATTSTSQSSDVSIVHLNTLLEHMDGGVIVAEVNEDINITYVSPSFFINSHLLSQGASLYGNKILSFVHSEDIGALREQLFSAAKSGSSFDTSYRVNTESGIEWRHIRCAKMPDMGDGIHRLIAVITDISDIKRSTAQLEAIIANAPCGIGIFEICSKGLIPVFYNQILARMAGLPPTPTGAELIDNTLFDPRDYEQVSSSFRNAINNNQPFDLTFRAVSPVSGESIVIQARGTQLYIQNNHTVALVIYNDVTKESNIAEQLRFAELRYRTAITQADILMWEADLRDQTLRHFGPVADRLGRSEHTFSNVPDSIINSGSIHPDSIADFRKLFEDIFSGRESTESLIRSIAPDGSNVWTKGHYSLLRDENGVPFYAIGAATAVSNIDGEIQQFDRQERFATLASALGLASFHANLTTDQVVATSSLPQLPVEEATTWAGVRDALLKIVPLEKDRHELSEFLSREHLMAHYHSGRKWLELQLTITGQDQNDMCVNIAIRLRRHPLTGELHCYTTFYDISAKRSLERRSVVPMERDAETLLYNMNSFAKLADIIIADHTDSECLFAVSVIKLSNFSSIKAENGVFFAREMLHNLGILCRLALRGSCIIGHMEENCVVVLRTDAVSRDNHQQHTAQALAHIGSILSEIIGTTELGLVCGYAIAEKEKASFSQLAANAMSACNTAVQTPGQPVTGFCYH